MGIKKSLTLALIVAIACIQPTLAAGVKFKILYEYKGQQYLEDFFEGGKPNKEAIILWDDRVDGPVVVNQDDVGAIILSVSNGVKSLSVDQEKKTKIKKEKEDKEAAIENNRVRLAFLRQKLKDSELSAKEISELMKIERFGGI